MRAPTPSLVGMSSALLMIVATLLATSPAAAEPPATAPQPVAGASAESTSASGDDGEAVSVPGVTLMIVGGAVALVGATMLVIDASRGEPETYDRGLDPGLGGVRGRAGQLALDDGATFSPVSAILLGTGALVHVVGVALVFGGDDDDAPAAPREEHAVTVEPIVAPGYGGLRGSF